MFFGIILAHASKTMLCLLAACYFWINLLYPLRNNACPCIAISHPSALNGVQKWHVFNMLQVSRFSKPFFHFVSDGRQHDFHKFSVVCEMTVSVMFLRQLLGEKKHEFRKLLKYVMFSIIICAHVSETILCVVFGGTCNFGMCPKLEQKSPASMFGKTPGGGPLPVHTKFWHI